MTAVRTAVHLLRHGEVHNPDGILYGRLPGFGLSENGREQARRVAEHLAGADVTALLVSPMQRAQETAAPIAEKLGLRARHRRPAHRGGQRFEGQRVASATARCAARRTGRCCATRSGRPGASRTWRSRTACSARRTGRGRPPPATRRVCVSHQLPIWTLRRFLDGQRLWHNPRRRQCALGSVTTLLFDDGGWSTSPTPSPPGAATPPRPAHDDGFRAAAALLVAALACWRAAHQQGRRPTTAGFNFVAPGGQTRSSTTRRRAAARCGRCRGRPCYAGHDRRARSTARPASSCSTSGARGAGRAAARPRTWSRSRSSGRGGVQCLGVDVRDDRHAAADFVRNRGITYPSIFDPPGRTLLALSGYPRNAVPVDDRAGPAAPGGGGVPHRDPRADLHPAGPAHRRRAGPVARALRPTQEPPRSHQGCRARTQVTTCVRARCPVCEPLPRSSTGHDRIYAS